MYPQSVSSLNYNYIAISAGISLRIPGKIFRRYLDKIPEMCYNIFNGCKDGSGAALCPDFCTILQKTGKDVLLCF